jgi:hypothetical protein
LTDYLLFDPRFFLNTTFGSILAAVLCFVSTHPMGESCCPGRATLQDSPNGIPMRSPYQSHREVIPLPQIPHLTFGECVGAGNFSQVYAGTYQGRPSAIKIIERGSDRAVEHEIVILSALSGGPHIIQLYEAISTETTLLIFRFSREYQSTNFAWK